MIKFQQKINDGAWDGRNYVKLGRTSFWPWKAIPKNFTLKLECWF